ncbi:MAG: DNA/RNA non-specific endonuclease [Mangrovicoccus sp.]
MREGYSPDFLGPVIDLPQPSPVLLGDVLQPPGMPDGEVVVPYIHYSLMMSVSTKQALFSAANVDLKNYKSTPKGQGRKWFYDGRIGRDNQVTNYNYKGTKWDRGHLTRRTAVTWGDSETDIVRASNDSCSYANSSMQHKNFNGDDWSKVETLVSDFQIADKITVITGPIFTQSDRYFAKEFLDVPVRVPSGFWKTVTYKDPGGELRTQAYIFFQDLPSIRNSDGQKRLNLKDMQVTTTELSLWTGLEFDQVLYDSNPLKFYSGPEAISIEAKKELLDKDERLVELDAGIATSQSVQEARKSLPLGDFYAVIEAVSWI